MKGQIFVVLLAAIAMIFVGCAVSSEDENKGGSLQVYEDSGDKDKKEEPPPTGNENQNGEETPPEGSGDNGDPNKEASSRDVRDVDVLFPYYEGCGYDFRDKAVEAFQKRSDVKKEFVICKDEQNSSKECCILASIPQELKSDLNYLSPCKLTVRPVEKQDREQIRLCNEMCNNDNQCPENQICADYMNGIAFCREKLDTDCTKEDVKNWREFDQLEDVGDEFSYYCNKTEFVCVQFPAVMQFRDVCNWHEATSSSNVVITRDKKERYGSAPCFEDKDCASSKSNLQCNIRVANMKFCGKERLQSGDNGDSNKEASSRDVDVLFPYYEGCHYDFKDKILEAFQKKGDTSLKISTEEYRPECCNEGYNCVQNQRKSCLLKYVSSEALAFDLTPCGVSVEQIEGIEEDNVQGLEPCGLMCSNDSQCPEGEICANYMNGLAFCRKPDDLDCTREDLDAWYAEVFKEDGHGGAPVSACNKTDDICIHFSMTVKINGICGWKTNSNQMKIAVAKAAIELPSNAYCLIPSWGYAVEGFFPCLEDSDCNNLERCYSPDGVNCLYNKCNTRVGNMKFCGKERRD